jgi:hypothetical protein
MADTTMCTNELCQQRKTCRRSTTSGTKISIPQRWAHFIREGTERENLSCSYYRPVEKDLSR